MMEVGTAWFRSRDGVVRVAGLCVIALLLACWSQAASADVYQCNDSHGNQVFTSHPDGYQHCHKMGLGAHHSGSSSAGAVHRRGKNVVLKGSVYQVVTSDGNVEYTNVAPTHRRGHKITRLFTYIDVCMACALHSSIDWTTVPLNVSSYRKVVRSAASRYGVAPAFLRAIIHAESAFNPDALSHKGAQGLMQLMPATAVDMGVGNAFDAAENIRGGARYLAKLLTRFHGDRELAAAAYNAGPGAVHKYKGVPPFAETRVYVKRVDTLYQRYAKALAGTSLAVTGQPGGGA